MVCPVGFFVPTKTANVPFLVYQSYVFVVHKFAFPTLILRTGTNKVRDLISGGRSRGVAHSTPTDQKPSIALIFCPVICWRLASKRKAYRGQVGYSY
jgi:hypothetical protein